VHPLLPRIAAAAAALLLAATARAQAEPGDAAPGLSAGLAFGSASFGATAADGERLWRHGLALELQVRYQRPSGFGVGYTLTWGLTDWDRAREWIDAGNRAGRWTSDRIRQVGDWAMEDEASRGLRLVGAFFADAFLVMTYAAVPACYVGSVGGATSHLQVDVTASLRSGGAVSGWVEGGLGALALPVSHREWDFGLGPVLGAGASLGPASIGARFLWSPPALRAGEGYRGAVTTAAVTLRLATP